MNEEVTWRWRRPTNHHQIERIMHFSKWRQTFLSLSFSQKRYKCKHDLTILPMYVTHLSCSSWLKKRESAYSKHTHTPESTRIRCAHKFKYFWKFIPQNSNILRLLAFPSIQFSRCCSFSLLRLTKGELNLNPLLCIFFLFFHYYRIQSLVQFYNTHVICSPFQNWFCGFFVDSFLYVRHLYKTHMQMYVELGWNLYGFMVKRFEFVQGFRLIFSCCFILIAFCVRNTCYKQLP